MTALASGASAPTAASSDDTLAEFFASVEILSSFAPHELAALAARAESRFFGFGDTIANAGEPADGLAIVRCGSVRVFTEEHGKEISVGVRKAGDVFAEVAMLRPYRHESAVRAAAKTEVVFVAREALAPIIAGNPAAQAFIASFVAIGAAGGFVTRLFDLRGKVDRGELEALVRSVGVKRVAAGTAILEQDARDDRRLYVVRRGAVSVVRTERGTAYPLATLAQGEVFGEKACRMRQEQFATVTATRDATLLAIPEKTVHFLLERNPRLREVLDERMHAVERELERQKRLAERPGGTLRLDFDSTPEPGEKLIKRFALVEQAEAMDCGAACLAMICRHYGLAMPLGKLRELANVTSEGATLDSLARAGESLGFTTRGLQCTFEPLLGFDLPFIVHWEGYHYVVVYGVSREHVWLADPAVGFRKLALADFERGWSGTCLAFTPARDLREAAAPRSPWRRFVGYLQPYRQILAYLFMATFVIQVLGIAPPVIIQNILDGVVVHENVRLLHLLLAGLVVTSAFTHVMSAIRAYLANFMVRNMDFAMMSQFLKHTLALPYGFFATRKTGDIFARFQENQTIRAFLTESTVTTVLNLMMVFVYFSIMFVYNVKLTLLLVAFVVPIVALTVLVTPRIKRYARETFTVATEAKSFLMEALGGVETIKGMAMERPVRLKWEAKYARALDVQYRAQGFNIVVTTAGQVLHAAATIAILWAGASLVLAHELTVGQLIAFNALMGCVLAPLLGLVGLWSLLNDAAVAMERLGDVLDVAPEQKPEELASRVVLPALRGAIRLDGAYFRYSGGDASYVLENVDLEIRPGELVAIVGPSGSGKTTLAKLLVGLYAPTDGRVLVDGYDLATVDKASYRAQVGYVLQANLLFSGTVAENIASGEEHADRRRIEEVARLADAHAFVSKLPLGYEQFVGERGMGLSGGQIQRLCIARALYRDPRVLIFDEATSALDTHSESRIVANLHEMLAGRTAVVVAHRLSTIMRADKIVVLQQGRIVEQGRHDELVAQPDSVYYQLVQSQLSTQP